MLSIYLSIDNKSRTIICKYLSGIFIDTKKINYIVNISVKAVEILVKSSPWDVLPYLTLPISAAKHSVQVLNGGVLVKRSGNASHSTSAAVIDQRAAYHQAHALFVPSLVNKKNGSIDLSTSYI